MAFIILGDREQEWERRPLRQAITIGRSFDCDLPVRDTLLSRKHCRLEPHGNQWVLIDLRSRNGTRVGENLITRTVLEDGDIVRIGVTRLCFRSGPFVAAAAPARTSARARPLDPREAMAATMVGVELSAGGDEITVPGFPTPRPMPVEPKAFQRDGVETLVSSIAASSWDSKRANQALVRRPTQLIPWTDVKKSPTDGVIQIRKPSTIELGEMNMKKPPRWLVMTYLCMAGLVMAASLCTIAWPMIERSV